MSSATPRPTEPQRPTQRRAAFWLMFLGRPRTRHHHLDALDGLRGLAVLIVLASHLSNMGLHLLPASGSHLGPILPNIVVPMW